MLLYTMTKQTGTGDPKGGSDMKKWFVGVDGGGTKTAVLAARKGSGERGAELATGCSYRMLGIDGAAKVIAEAVKSSLQKVGADLTDCAGVCVGLPCFGEDPRQDEAIGRAIQKALTPAPVHIVNDVEVGWAGALAGQPGIHIVAGTGSIAFAKNGSGQTARTGGWNEFFGDEGSCYWIGREAMSVFTKEADGRLPRGALYESLRRDLSLGEDMDFIDLVTREYAPYRQKVAGFQRFAAQAAQAGDPEARVLYPRAAHELALMARALKDRLAMPEGTKVSYSGGLFRTGELILKPLKKEITALGCVLEAPKSSGAEGAWLLAAQYFED